MSDDLYHRRVIWEGLRARGSAKVEEVTVKLSQPPRLVKAFLDVWYSPEVGQLEIRDDALHARRSMSHDEQVAMEIWCDQLLRVIRGFLSTKA